MLTFAAHHLPHSQAVGEKRDMAIVRFINKEESQHQMQQLTLTGCHLHSQAGGEKRDMAIVRFINKESQHQA